MRIKINKQPNWKKITVKVIIFIILLEILTITLSTTAITNNETSTENHAILESLLGYKFGVNILDTDMNITTYCEKCFNGEIAKDAIIPRITIIIAIISILLEITTIKLWK